MNTQFRNNKANMRFQSHNSGKISKVTKSKYTEVFINLFKGLLGISLKTNW